MAKQKKDAPPPSDFARRKRYESRHAVLKQQRKTWDSEWCELADYFLPNGARFITTDTNRGDRRDYKILNGKPLVARRTLSAGVLSMVYPAAREWLELTVDDPALSEMQTVKEYLSKTKAAIYAAFNRSNFYKEVQRLVEDLVVFGTHCQFIDEDDEDDVRFYPLPIGSYCLARDARGKVNAVFYETQMTVEQVVEKFGIENVCEKTRRAYETGTRFDEPITVVRVVEPRRDVVPGAVGYRGMKWASCWYESEGKGFLREGGHNECPFIAPVWVRLTGDTYGRGPASDALPDAKALQEEAFRKNQMGDLIVSQPVQGPPELEAHLVGMLPGDYTAVAGMANGAKVTPVMDVASLQAAKNDCRENEKELEGRIDDGMLVDTVLMLQSRTEQKTATEVAEMRDEKYLQLSPLTDNLKDDGQDPMVARTVGVLGRKGKLPPAPEELIGKTFNIRYVSPMAQAQRMQATVGMQRLVVSVLSVAEVHPEVKDKVDFDQWVDEQAKALGTPASVTRPDDVVKQIRQQRAQAQQQANAAAMAQQAAQTGKTLAQTPLGGNEQTALDALLRTRGAA